MNPTSGLRLALVIGCLICLVGLAKGATGDRQPAVGPSAESPAVEPAQASPAAGEKITWQVCAPAGGAAASTSCRMVCTIGQAGVGLAASPGAKFRAGFWQQFKAPCAITMSGDVNGSGTITSSDVIVLVNYVFKSQAPPQPCPANGDVNCTGSVTSADIIYMVNHVFKGQAGPCDVCSHGMACVP